MATMRQFEKITTEVNAYLKDQNEPAHKPMMVSEVAMGFIEVANEAMCRPIRALTQVRESAHHRIVAGGWGDMYEKNDSLNKCNECLKFSELRESGKVVM